MDNTRRNNFAGLAIIATYLNPALYLLCVVSYCIAMLGISSSVVLAPGLLLSYFFWIFGIVGIAQILFAVVVARIKQSDSWKFRHHLYSGLSVWGLIIFWLILVANGHYASV